MTPMTWDYRLFKEPTPDGSPWLTFREVYYRKGVPISYSANEIAAHGLTVEEVREQLQRMLRALDMPLVKAENFTGGKTEHSASNQTTTDEGAPHGLHDS